MELLAYPRVVSALSNGWEYGRSESNDIRNGKMDARVPRDEKLAGKGGKLIRQQVGAKLKQLYADVMSEPIPDRFKELIEILEPEWDNSETPKSKQDKHPEHGISRRSDRYHS
jgi:hypothetical protein